LQQDTLFYRQRTLSETTAKALGTHLEREGIWYCLLYQKGKYRGLKFGINSKQEFLLAKGLIALTIEQLKTLKQEESLINI